MNRKYEYATDKIYNLIGNEGKIPLQKVAFKLDISASSGGNPESAG